MKKIIIEIKRENDVFFYPRDVRNYIGSIVAKDFEDIFMWHERSTAPFIYSMPQKHSIAIQTYRTDMQDALEHVCGKLIANPSIKLNGSFATVKNVTLKAIDYSSFASGMYEYETRTPLIIGKSLHERNDLMALASEGEAGRYEMTQLVRQAIAETIETQTRHWYGKGMDISEELTIIIKGEMKPFLLKYKENRYYPAVMTSFVSNMRLPGYVGYKIGMGYGELRHISHAKSTKINTEESTNV